MQPPPRYSQVPPAASPGSRAPGADRPPGGPVPPYGGAGAGMWGAVAPRKRRALRFLAATCIVSAWLTLILSLFGAGSAVAMGLGLRQFAATALPGAAGAESRLPPLPSPSAGSPLGGALPGESGWPGFSGLPSPTGSGDAAGQPLAAAGGLLQPILATACFVGALFTLLTGIAGFLLFLGLGQACYVLIDLEQEMLQVRHALRTVAARLGVGGV